jgi:hypothetical protein
LIGEMENHVRSEKSKSVSIAGILLLCLGVLLTLASAAALVSSRGDSSAAIASVPCLLMAASGLAAIRRWRGWRYYSGVWALLLAYAGVGSVLVGIKELLIEAFIPREEIGFHSSGSVFGVAFILIACGSGLRLGRTCADDSAERDADFRDRAS